MDKIVKEMKKTITILVFGSLRRFEEQIKNHSIYLDSNKKIAVRDLIQRLEIPTTEIALINVNKTAVDEKYMVKAGDTISIYSPVGGG